HNNTRRGFSTRLVKRDGLCVVAQPTSRAEMHSVRRSLGVTPKRQERRLSSVLIVLRTPAARKLSHEQFEYVKGRLSAGVVRRLGHRHPSSPRIARCRRTSARIFSTWVMSSSLTPSRRR